MDTFTGNQLDIATFTNVRVKRVEEKALSKRTPYRLEASINVPQDGEVPLVALQQAQFLQRQLEKTKARIMQHKTRFCIHPLQFQTSTLGEVHNQALEYASNLFLRTGKGNQKK